MNTVDTICLLPREQFLVLGHQAAEQTRHELSTATLAEFLTSRSRTRQGVVAAGTGSLCPGQQGPPGSNAQLEKG